MTNNKYSIRKHLEQPKANNDRLSTTSNILDTLPTFDGIDISNVKLYMPLVDDVKLLEQFNEVEL